MIEYRIIPITRYMVTRFEEGENCVGSESLGEFDNERKAYRVAEALKMKEERETEDTVRFADAEHRERQMRDEEEAAQKLADMSRLD